MKFRRRWTAQEIAVLRAKYADHHTADLMIELRRPDYSIHNMARKLGIRKSRAEIAYTARQNSLKTGHGGVRTRFAPGAVPWNEGVSFHAGGRSVDTQFKPGSVSARWDPTIYCVGALRISTDGVLEMKVREGSRSWYSLARWTWEQHHGPIPPDMVIRAINGDPYDTQIENLRLATRREVMGQNSVHNLPKPLASAIQLKGALVRRINRLKKERA